MCKSQRTVEVIDWVEKKRKKEYSVMFLGSHWFSLQLNWLSKRTCNWWTVIEEWAKRQTIEEETVYLKYWSFNFFFFIWETAKAKCWWCSLSPHTLINSPFVLNYIRLKDSAISILSDVQVLGESEQSFCVWGWEVSMLVFVLNVHTPFVRSFLDSLQK